jgi:hypothetical protein
MIRVCCPFNIQAKAEVKVDIPEFDPGRTPSPTDAALYGHRGLTGAAERCEKSALGNEVRSPPNSVGHVHWRYDEIVCSTDTVAKENAGHPEMAQKT